MDAADARHSALNENYNITMEALLDYLGAHLVFEPPQNARVVVRDRPKPKGKQ